MTNLINNIFAIEVPEDVIDCRLNSAGNILWPMLPGHVTTQPIDLPPGTWQLLFLTRDATDSDWEKMVERDSKYPEWWYKDYELKSPFCYNSTQSGHSLLRSKGLNPDKNYVLIEKIC